MGWAKFAIEGLQRGETVQIRPRRHSMKGRVEDGALVTLAPWPAEQYEVGDVVLVKVSGNVYLHLIKAIDGERYQIGNNRGRINGWVGKHALYGKAIKIGE